MKQNVNMQRKSLGYKNTTGKKIRDKMRELDFFPKKFLGQHFLINSLIIQKIVYAVLDLKPSLIVEVGPGLGALTDEFILLRQSIYVVEMDSVLCRYWREKEVQVLEGDVLKLLWQSKLLPDSVLTGNLPYQTASRLLVKNCPGPDELKAMVLMFQEEVGHRILAKPRSKEYGLLSVLAQCFWRINILTAADISDFYPRPKVAGWVLIFRRKKHSVLNPGEFLLFVKFCFSQRRKFLLSRLKKRKEGKLAVDIFNKLNLSSSVRAEELSPGQFVSLFNQFEKRKNLP